HAVGDRIIQHLVSRSINYLDPRVVLVPHHIHVVVAYGVVGAPDTYAHIRGVMHDVLGNEAVVAYGNYAATDTGTGVVFPSLIHNVVTHRALVREHAWNPIPQVYSVVNPINSAVNDGV